MQQIIKNINSIIYKQINELMAYHVTASNRKEVRKSKNNLKIKGKFEEIGLKTRLEEGKGLNVTEISRERVPDFGSRG